MNDFMMTILIFTICSIINVMLNTAKTIIMYKKNKVSSSLINAVTYGFYTVIVVLMAGEMPLMWKICLTAITNFIGVWLSMCILARFEKDKLWEVRVTALNSEVEDIIIDLREKNLPFNYITGVGKYTLFNIYCETQKESLATKEILKKYNVKYFVSESKTL